MDKTEKLAQTHRLQKARLGNASSTLCDIFRQQYKETDDAIGKRGLAAVKARADMWALLEPAVEESERRLDNAKAAREQVAMMKKQLSEKEDEVKSMKKQLRASQKTTDQAVAAAVEEAVNGAKFRGHAGDVDDIVDPNYHETDPGRQSRDSWLWAGFEFARITKDLPDGSTVMDFSKAKTPPPTAMAIGIAESYGRRPPDDRRGLYDKMATFAEKTHTPTDDPGDSEVNAEAEFYLAQLGQGPCETSP